jgi:alkylation response protein AidB-like acyl-CoA dehydrogenase
MDVRLSPEQLALRVAVAQAVDRLGPHTVADLDDTDRTRRLDTAVADAGWRELRAGDGDAVGPLASGVEAAIVAEELGRGLADVSFIGPTLAAELRRLGQAPEAAVPETVAFVADLSAPARAVGTTVPAAVAVDTAGARHALVLVPVDGGDRLATSSPGRAEPPLDLTRSTWSSEAVAASPLAGGEAIGEDALARWRALGLALTCADLVGVMRGAVTLARDYAGQRQQYGTPIGAFQAVQHLLADAHVAAEGSRSVALYAAWAVDALDPADAVAAGSVAKAYCSRAARDVCEAAIQVHGGIGNTWDCLAHVYLRRALLSTDLFGGVGPSIGRVLAHHGIGGQ